MATTFSKTYSVTVDFSRDDEETITESDLQSVEMRAEIQARILSAVQSSKGIYSSHIDGSVSET